MAGTILWLIGMLCTIWCVLDIFRKPLSTGARVIASLLVVLTSWFGLFVYYFYGRHHLYEWFR